jgi:hypothetical protein
METITEEEKKVALLCRGAKSPLQISKDLHLNYDEVQSVIERLEKMDILGEQTLK